MIIIFVLNGYWLAEKFLVTLLRFNLLFHPLSFRAAIKQSLLHQSSKLLQESSHSLSCLS